MPTENLPWPQKNIRRASINSFGIGGSNAHVIVDSFEGYNQEEAVRVDTTSHCPAVFLVTGASKQSLRLNISNLLDFLGGPRDWSLDMLTQLARVINARSQVSVRPYRAYFVADAVEQLKSALHAADVDRIQYSPRSKPARLFFVFTGQGAVWSQMGRELVEIFSTARETVERLDEVVWSLQAEENHWSLKGQ